MRTHSQIAVSEIAFSQVVASQRHLSRRAFSHLARILASAGIACMIGLSGCSATDSDSEGSDLPGGALALGADPMNIENSSTGSVVADFATGTWTLYKSYGSCSPAGVFGLDTGWSTRNFAVVADTLYTWNDNSCDARTWAGGSSTLAGTWTPVGTAPVPDTSWRSGDGCDSASTDTEEVSLAFADGNLTTREVWTDYCWSEMAIGWNDDPTVTSTAAGCNRVEMTQVGRSATLTLEAIDLDTDGEFVTFTSGGTTCRLESPSRYPSSDGECAEAYAAWQADSSAAPGFDIEEYSARALAQAAYEECVAATGWTGPH
jgi:hypothetical protein